MNVGSELEKIANIFESAHISNKKKRRKRQKRLVVELLHDYAQNSTLHGLRYMVQRGLSFAEKFFWFVTVVISIGLCSIYIYDAYHKYVTSPVIVAVNEKQTSVAVIPFPSVTICPQVKVDRTVYKYKEQLDEILISNSSSDRDREELTHISSMCDSEDFSESKILTNISLVEDITRVALTQDNIFVYCLWHSNITNCTDLFKKVYTQEGVCYTANSLAEIDIFENTIQKEYPYLESRNPQVGWSLANGYNFSVKSPYPQRGRIFGSESDLELLMVHNPEQQNVECNQIFSGYKIYLHHPADFPQSSLYYYAAIPNQVTSLAISVHELNSDSSLVNYEPEIRQCYFPKDRKLRYFKIYTEKNCQAECLSNYTFAICKCVGYYMPHHNSSEICSVSSNNRDCMNIAKDFMAENEMDADPKLEQCRCFPACNSASYDAEVLKTPYLLKNLIKRYDHNSSISFSLVSLYFKQPQFVTMQRRELIGKTELLADIGGLLGLFLGFSFLSLIEILYFLTLRVGCTLKRDLQEEKKANSELKQRT